MDRTTQGPPVARTHLGLTVRVPVILPSALVCQSEFIPAQNSVTSFAVERYFIWPAKYEACVQHDKRDEQRSVLNRYRRNHYSPKPYKTPSGLPLSINTWLLSMITIIANHNQVSTYNSQVTGNYPTSTGLSMTKQLFDPDLTG
jgi:hypothetical protein